MDVSFAGQKIKRNVATIIAICMVLFLVSCSKLGDGINFSYLPHVVDFKHSQMLSNGPQAADGSSALLIVVSLLNSDDTPVTGFTPTYQVVSGSGVTSSPCTSSNSNGVSTCLLRSSQIGTKRIVVTNVTIVLQTDVSFTAPVAGRSSFGLAAASSQQSQGTYRFTGSVGTLPATKRTSGTYSFFGSFQGEEFSR